MSDNPQKSRSIRALEVMECVSSRDNALSAAEIESMTGLPKATVHRLCNLLMDQGYLRRDISARGYEMGERFAQLSLRALSNQGRTGERHAILERAVRDIGETCNVTVPKATEMLYLDRVESEWPIRIQLPPGTTVPLHCTASGKLYLSSLPKARRESMIQKLHLQQHAPNTIVDREELSSALDEIARTEIGTDEEEFIQGLVAVAVPVKEPNGRMVATLATHGPIMRMTFDDAFNHVERLRSAASELAQTLDER